MIGFLNIYKPSGITSNAVVQRIRKKFGLKKVGHMGTLDPLACGILPIAIGKATRLFDYSLDKTKRYTAIFDFGYTTDTLDITGEKITTNGMIPSINEIEKCIKQLIGTINQTPPLFSAKNVNGVRAYDLARKGIDFELKPKEITIYDIKLIEQVSEYQFKFDITCSSGTYIRAIARDLAELAGTYGCMSYLERTETGNFTLEKSVTLEEILGGENLENYLISPMEAFSNFKRVEINEETFNDLINGKRTDFRKLDKNTFIVYKGDVVGIAKANSDKLILETFLY